MATSVEIGGALRCRDLSAVLPALSVVFGHLDAVDSDPASTLHEAARSGEAARFICGQGCKPADGAILSLVAALESLSAVSWRVVVPLEPQDGHGYAGMRALRRDLGWEHSVSWVVDAACGKIAEPVLPAEAPATPGEATDLLARLARLERIFEDRASLSLPALVLHGQGSGLESGE